VLLSCGVTDHWLEVGRCSPLAHWLGGQACWDGASCLTAGSAAAEDGGTRFAMCFILVVSCVLRVITAIYDYLVCDCDNRVLIYTVSQN